MNSQDFRQLINRIDNLGQEKYASPNVILEHLGKYKDLLNKIITEMDRRSFLGNLGKGAIAASTGLVGLSAMARSKDGQVPEGYSPREWQIQESLAMIQGVLAGVRSGLTELAEKKNLTNDEQIKKTIDTLQRAFSACVNYMQNNLAQKKFDKSQTAKIARRLHEISQFHFKNSLDIMRFGDSRAEISQAMDFIRQLSDAGMFKY